MRRALTQRAFKRVLAAGVEAGESTGLASSTTAKCVTLGEIQAASARQSAPSRLFSNSRTARTSAAESQGQQAPPYARYGAVGAASLGVITYFLVRQPDDSSVSTAAMRTEKLPPPPGDGIELGKFNVLDHTGMHFTQDDLLGDFSVLYFGTIDHPGRRTRLLQMAEAVMESDRKSNMHYLNPVFLTLNPKEDDVIKMNAMVEDYAHALNRKSILNVRLKGLTGDDNLEVHKRAQAYTAKIKAKDGVENAPENATAEDCGDLYFVSPEGEFLASYGPDATPKAIATEWSDAMKAYRLTHAAWHGPKSVKTRSA